MGRATGENWEESRSNNAIANRVKNQVSLIPKTKFLHQTRAVSLGGAAADEKDGGDFGIGPPGGGVFEDDEFAFGKGGPGGF